jgi:hypothetical protein
LRKSRGDRYVSSISKELERYLVANLHPAPRYYGMHAYQRDGSLTHRSIVIRAGRAEGMIEAIDFTVGGVAHVTAKRLLRNADGMRADT